MTEPIWDSATLSVEALDQLVAIHPKILTAHDGRPLAALIDYRLYLAIKDQIDEWRVDQRAVAAYTPWLNLVNKNRT